MQLPIEAMNRNISLLPKKVFDYLVLLWLLPHRMSYGQQKLIIQINCGCELYQWLAVKLAERGLVVVTFSWVGENLPGIVVGLTL